MLFLLSLPSRLSSVSVVFDFSAPPSAVAPVSPILLSVVLMIILKKLMDAIFVFLLLSSRKRLSSGSAVFDFNASINDAAPASPILFSIDCDANGKEWTFDGCHLCVVSFVFTPKTELNERCV